MAWSDDVRPLTAGECRHRITLVATIEQPDGEGGRRAIDSEIGSFWASVSPVSGIEAVHMVAKGAIAKGAMQLYGEISHVIRMLYPVGVTIDASMRILFGAETLHIVAVTDDREEHRELLIAATKGV